MPVFAGIDGGGSATRVRVTDAAGRQRGEGRAGPGSLTAGAEVAAANVRAALEAALAAAGATLSDCRLVCGLAGHRQAARRAAFEARLGDALSLEVIADGYAALLGAHQGAPGAIVIVGTGSVGLRLEADGRCHQAGGWGPVAGDEGGGNWLGREAVRAALRAADDAGAPPGDTPFLCAVRDHLGGHHERILDWIAAADAAGFARLAPLVISHAAAADPAAERLLARATREVERLIRLTSRDGRHAVALAGGLATTFQPRLATPVRDWLRAPRGDAMDGALLRARGLAPPETYVT